MTAAKGVCQPVGEDHVYINVNSYIYPVCLTLVHGASWVGGNRRGFFPVEWHTFLPSQLLRSEPRAWGLTHEGSGAGEG